MSCEIISGPVGYVTVQNQGLNTTDRVAALTHLQNLGDIYVYNGLYPDFAKQFCTQDRPILQAEIKEAQQSQTDGQFSFSWHPENPFGNFLNKNTHREGVVLPSPGTIENIEALLAQEPDITTLVFGVYSNGIRIFDELSKYLRIHHPNITIVAGAVGAQFPEVVSQSNAVLHGDQLTDMRMILGEDPNDPRQIPIIRSSAQTHYEGVTVTSQYPIVMTSYGCPYGCDFCPSTAQYGKAFITPHTAHNIIEAIYEAYRTVNSAENRITLTLADPQGLGDISTWKEVFHQCKNMGFVVELVTTSSSRILEKYSLEELTTGDLHLSCVNIGVESMAKPYPKNYNVDLTETIARYQNAGIRVAVTFIVGHDFQSTENIWYEVEMLKQLHASGYILSNLLMEPGTPAYAKMQQTGRLLNVPPEFTSTYGYQAFQHPSFSAGFKDMFPILQRIDAILAQDIGMFTTDTNIFLNSNNPGLRQLREQLQKELVRVATLPNLTDDERSKLQTQAYYQIVYKQPALFHPYLLWNV